MIWDNSILNKKVNEVLRMIENTKDLEQCDKYGIRPIHRLCEYRSLEVILAIIEKGVNLEAATVLNWRPIHWACAHSTFEIVSIF